jgi:hypothetical protein
VIAVVLAVVALLSCSGGSDTAEVRSAVGPPTQTVRRDLGSRLRIPVAQIHVVRVERRIWPDGCLGLPSPEFCAPRPTPGFRITLAAGEERYRYRTNRSGGFRFAGKVTRSR